MSMSKQEMTLDDFLPAVYKWAAEAYRISPAARAMGLEELQSVAMEYAWRGLEEYDDSKGMKLTTYVIQRIRWGMLDTADKAHRQAKRNGGVSLHAEDGGYIVEPSYEQAHAIDFEDEAYRMLDFLSGDDRKVVELRLWQGLEFREISKIMGWSSMSSAFMRYQRAIEKLQKLTQ